MQYWSNRFLLFQLIAAPNCEGSKNCFFQVHKDQLVLNNKWQTSFLFETQKPSRKWSAETDDEEQHCVEKIP